MSRVAIDSNVLIYAELEPHTDKGRRASDVISRADRDGVIPLQAVGELLRFIQRRAPASLPTAVQVAADYRQTFICPATTAEVVEAASKLAVSHHVQIWDSIIAVAASRAGAVALLTEDLQDGRMFPGLRFINPFDPANDALIDTLLGPAPSGDAPPRGA